MSKCGGYVVATEPRDAKRTVVAVGDYVTIYGTKSIGKILWIYENNERATIKWSEGNIKAKFLSYLRKVEIEDLI